MPSRRVQPLETAVERRPSTSTSSTSLVPRSTPRRYRLGLGIATAIASVVVGWHFSALVFQSFGNDHWWPCYSLAYQAYLIDVLNDALLGSPNGSVNLVSDSARVAKTYDIASAFTSIYPTYMRHLVLHELTSVEHGIASLRTMSPGDALTVQSQYCWVDFAKELEMAHTAARQARCARYAANGAMYLASVLRNIDYGAFTSIFGGIGGPFTVGLGLGLQETATGRAFLQSLEIITTPIAQEADIWMSFGLDRFELQWHNKYQTGITEHATILNALGHTASITLKDLPRRLGSWSSGILNWQLNNDLYSVQACNQSLLRNNELVLQAASVLAPPFADETIHSGVLEPTPPTWATGYDYHGGSPLCLHSSPTPFVQPPFDANALCTGAHRLTTPFSFPSLLLARAMTMAIPAADLCACDVSGQCAPALAAAHLVLKERQLNTAGFDPTTLGPVGIMQYATSTTNASNWTLLYEPLFSPDAFRFYGWLMLYDWAIGAREVVAFEGDVSTLTLISNTYAVQTYPTSGGNLYVPNSTQMIAYIILYTTAVASVVLLAALCSTYALPARVEPTNWLAFHRLVGAAWVGRPLLLIRGGAAIIMLSTANVQLQHSSNGGSYFSCDARSIIDVFVLSIEATWLSLLLQDVARLLVPEATHSYATPCAALACGIHICLEVLDPITPVASLQRTCASTNLDAVVVCAGASVVIGSVDRAQVLVATHVLLTLLGIVSASMWRRTETRRAASDMEPPFYLLSGLATLYLAPTSPTGVDAVPNDPVACLLAGLIPFTTDDSIYLFDLNRWLVVKSVLNANEAFRPLHSNVLCVSRRTTLQRPQASVSAPMRMLVPPVSRWTRWWSKLVYGSSILVCLGYMALSIQTSVLYLRVSATALSNDLAWANFSMHSTHRFLASILSADFALGNFSARPLQLDAIDVNLVTTSLDDASRMTLPGNFGARVQMRTLEHALRDAIQGLRSTPAADMPWIFSAYCYLDLNQTFAMANSMKRQARCRNMTTNGAVYLETILRNTEWDDLLAVWGNAFHVAFGRDLEATNMGINWLRAVRAAATNWVPPDVEAAYWRRSGLTTFTLQWQNFKTIGLVNTYRVVSASSAYYPFTLASLNGSYRIPSETSYKMYWGLANDFRATLRNGSGMTGQSLLSNSANYAYANTTPAAVLLRNGILNAPIGRGLQLVSDELGPFGSTDMYFVPVPTVLRAAVDGLRRLLHTLVAENASALATFLAIDTSVSVWPVPGPWIQANFLSFGGSVLCDAILPTAAPAVGAGLLVLFSFDYGCDAVPYYASLQLNRATLVPASLLSAVHTQSNWTDICRHDPYNLVACDGYLNSTTSFTSTFGLAEAMARNDIHLSDVYASVAALDIQILQYGSASTNDPLSLERLPLLNPADPTYDLFAFAYLLEWVSCDRDVVHFQGDNMSLTLLSEKTTPIAQAIYAAELPSALASYAQSANMFVTSLLLLIALLLTLYMWLARGYVERRNVLKLNRIGAMSYVGRPLIFVRSATAMMLLATASLELHITDGLAFLAPGATSWLSVLLASSEVTWLVEVVNDMAMVLTRSHAAQYAAINSLSVWAATALLSWNAPVTFTAIYAPVCRLSHMDLQVTCETAAITIGHWQRIATLACLTLSVNALCYSIVRSLQRWRWLWRLVPAQWRPKDSVPAPTKKVQSLLLSAGATFLFYHAPWIFNDVYYLDRASAALNGLLSVRYDGIYYVLDIKLWRILVLAPTPCPPQHPKYAAAQYALPLSLH
ncbi:hypothetical protein SPRG_22090 [Saprolegnia parasitica CBS 223.65]|uniref:Uncharacterized protein n=1 Tax=Saprolegnia parasitica (strain CBS 223.65) TaxID=695850 RepID=A0A067D4D2_SAPPC|nr:hypothetical protein SPRG_22090 [Saprolegnia parasitica CBS 223.65]KDO33581.1 hypothetical protein SPRG_22090 [Saprolegnia parasitica CBS 223.65]|eukprot:XP_012195768.1 hypothetical protein SPRG_22090 [Saprolegnia parasitica CBS 223.65]